MSLPETVPSEYSTHLKTLENRIVYLENEATEFRQALSDMQDIVNELKNQAPDNNVQIEPLVIAPAHPTTSPARASASSSMMKPTKSSARDKVLQVSSGIFSS